VRTSKCSSRFDKGIACTTDQGWLYVALVLDLHARLPGGLGDERAMPQELTLQALDVALGWRDPHAGLVHRSDLGSQYAANDYRSKLKAWGITVSMSRKGDCWDNAPMESVNGTLKVECVYDMHLETREQARCAIVEYIGYYNTERRHSALGYVSPAKFERRWRAGVANPAPAELSQRAPPRYPPPAGSGSSQATEPAVRG
jgi:putative transposase